MRYKICKFLEIAFQRLAFIGLKGWKYSDFPHPYFSGFRNRLYHVGIAFGWLALPGCYKSFEWHFLYGTLPRFIFSQYNECRQR